MATPTAPPLQPSAPAPAGFIAKLGLLAADIKLSHTVFALPFALLGMGLACGWAERWPRWTEAVLIVFCMVTARTFAMCVNRLADARIDAQNPRTERRVVADGTVSKRFTTATIVVNAFGFIAGAVGFWWLHGNPWPTWLALPVLGVLALYSFTKRFTWLCHMVLGLALALSPLAAALAIEPDYLTAGPTPWLIAAMVLGWVAGFDVIYALQDAGVDRELGLCSMPASLGVGVALWISRLLHLAAAACLVAAWWLSPQLGNVFVVAVGLTVALLILEHALVWRSSTHRIHLAFFTVNGIISLLLGAAGLVDVMLHAAA